MKLVCEKFKESMESEEAECRHPNDYCPSRTSCMILFLEKERKREQECQKKKASQEKN